MSMKNKKVETIKKVPNSINIDTMKLKQRMMIYDIKTICPVYPSPDRLSEVNPDIKYAKSYNDFENLGIALIACYYYPTNEYRLFFDDSFDFDQLKEYPTNYYKAFSDHTSFVCNEFQNLLQNTDILIGYNNIMFDDRLIQEGSDLCIYGDTMSYDLLVEIWKSKDIMPSTNYPNPNDTYSRVYDFSPKIQGGHGLSKVLKINFDYTSKFLTTENGQSDFSELYQTGEHSELIDGCLRDIQAFKKLIDRVILDGFIQDPKNPKNWLKIVKPETRWEQFQLERKQLNNPGNCTTDLTLF